MLGAFIVERDAYAVRQILKLLGLIEAREIYHTLSEIAAARGNSAAAAMWAKKQDDPLAEVDRRVRGGRDTVPQAGKLA